VTNAGLQKEFGGPRLPKLSYLDLARLLGAEIVTEETLPPGPGVLDSEVGEPGPWYGVRWPDGTVEGWARDPVHLYGLLADRLIALLGGAR
jgi:hypothetical protein